MKITFQYTYKLFGQIVFIMLLLPACKKWVDVNYDPSQLTETSVTPDLVLAGALKEQAGTALKRGFLYRWMGYLCVPMASSGTDEQTYNITPASPDMTGMNAIGIRTFRLIESKGNATGQTFYVGIAKVMKAMIFAEDVDVFNNIPYRESGDPIRYQYPAYDDAKFIYEDIIKMIDTGVALIKNADIAKNTRITQADIMFHANKTRWVKFANTLQLRLLMHQANRIDRTTYIQQVLAKIQAEGSGFLGSGEDASVNPGFTELRYNSFYGIYAFNPGGFPADQSTSVMANIIAMNFLKDNHDPRLGYFYTEPELPLPPGTDEPFVQPLPSNYRGNKYGLPIDRRAFPFQSAPFVSRMGGRTIHGPVTSTSSGILKGYDMDQWMLTSVESLFLQAEAIFRGWLPGNAKQAYFDAVRESFRWLNVGENRADLSLSDAVFSNWYALEDAANNDHVSWDDASDKYKLLMFQKYLALNGLNAQETWTDYRRNGSWPVIPLSADPGRTANKLPVRLPYAASEYAVNRAHVTAQGEIDVFNSKIWWMP